MLAVNVPDQAKPLFERLALMPEEEFDAISNALNTAPPNLRPEKFSVEVKNILPGVNQIVDLVEAVVGLSRSSRDSSVTVDELVNAVAEAVLAKKKSQPPTDPAVLVHRLTTLLNIKSVKLYARASNVQHQYENIFLSARIISDIRTVFESDDTQPLGAMVVHNLKITSLNGGEHQQNKFFALDNLDLDLLQQCIDRAREKTKSLEKIIEESRLTYFPSK